MFIQALVINVTPLLFIPLREEFGLTFEQIGRLILVNFLTQLAVDLVCTALADRVHPRPLVLAANLLAGVGLCGFAVLPFHLASPYAGLMIGTVIFSLGCGLLEVLLSPIVNAIPSENKSARMAVLHAFYPIGKVAVILVTGSLLHLAGADSWPWILIGWSVFGIVNAIAFSFVAIPPLADAARRHTLRSMLRTPVLALLLVCMVLAGATEVTIAQWTSAYVEVSLGLPKVIADLVGFALFGVGMIVGRLWFGLKGDQANLNRVMLLSALLSCAMCVLMAVSPSPVVAILATGCSGIFVSMLWPGTISLSAAAFPLAGASLYALLAAAGDGGAALMPWLVGVVADHSMVFQGGWLRGLGGEGGALGLRVAYLFTALCPLIMVPAILGLRHVSGDESGGSSGLVRP